MPKGATLLKLVAGSDHNRAVGLLLSKTDQRLSSFDELEHIPTRISCHTYLADRLHRETCLDCYIRPCSRRRVYERADLSSHILIRNGSRIRHIEPYLA